ncbi:MAG: hypothetical protein ACOX0Z_00390 [Candidatus Nanosyncoccaceae bacterium]|jgi:hypothetical protein
MSEFLGPENKKLENVESLEVVLDPESTQAMGELAVGHSPEENENPEEYKKMLDDLVKTWGEDLGSRIYEKIVERYKLLEHRDSIIGVDDLGELAGNLMGVLYYVGANDPESALIEAGVLE